MSEQKTICEFYEQDHDRLDELFKTFQKMKRSDFAKAKEAFKEFKFGLQRHIVWEEDLLFPLWEKKTGMSEDGPTVVMRVEHRQIGQQLEAIHGKVAEQNPDSDQEGTGAVGPTRFPQYERRAGALSRHRSGDQCGRSRNRLSEI